MFAKPSAFKETDYGSGSVESVRPQFSQYCEVLDQNASQTLILKSQARAGARLLASRQPWKSGVWWCMPVSSAETDEDHKFILGSVSTT